MGDAEIVILKETFVNKKNIEREILIDKFLGRNVKMEFELNHNSHNTPDMVTILHANDTIFDQKRFEKSDFGTFLIEYPTLEVSRDRDSFDILKRYFYCSAWHLHYFCERV